MQNLHCPPILADRVGLSEEPFFVLRFQPVVKCLLVALAIDFNNLTKNRNSIRTIDRWMGAVHRPGLIFVKAAAIVACVGVAMVEAQGYGGGPGSSTSSAEWLCPASLLVSLVALVFHCLSPFVMKTIIFPVGICRHLMGHVAVVQSGCVMNLRKQSMYRIQSGRGI